MQFDDPRSILEAAAAKPTGGIDAPALVQRGRRLRRARYAAAAAGMAVSVLGGTAAIGLLDGDRGAGPRPAASPCADDPFSEECVAGVVCNRPLPLEAAIFLRGGASEAEVLELRRVILARPGVESVDYFSHEDAYEEFVALYEGKSELYVTVDPEDLPASLRVTVTDRAALERIHYVTSPIVDETRSGLGLYERACEGGAETAPDPEPPSTSPIDPLPTAPPRALVVDVVRAECRIGAADLGGGGSADFVDGSKWCSFVLHVDNRAGSPLRLDLDDQMLWAKNGHAATPWEDAMLEDFSTRLFTSPIPPGGERVGQVIFLLPPDDVPSALEVRARRGFAPISIPLEYACAADLRDEPRERCSVRPSTSKTRGRSSASRS